MANMSTGETGLFDTREAYGTVSRTFHWVMAALLLWQILSVLSHELLKDSAVEAFLFGQHFLVGFTIFVLAILRGIWGLINISHRPPHVAGALGKAAVAGQTLMYLLMLGTPLVGLIYVWGSECGFSLLGVQIFAPQDQKIEWTAKLFEQLHDTFGWALFALIAGHIAMAFLHPKFGGERVLPRMVPGRD